MNKLNISGSKCVHCGACTAACKGGALKMEAESWTISYNELLCTNCSACVKACPSRALSFQAQIRRTYVSGKNLPQVYENR
jgi:ferredoxin